MRKLVSISLICAILAIVVVWLLHYKTNPMSDPQWLNGYSGQSVKELTALEGTYRIDSLVLAFEQIMNQKAARVGKANLSDEERIICAIEALEREVNNGGYDQFFLNTPEYAPIIVQSLRRIGCPATAEITQKALLIAQRKRGTTEIKNGVSDEREERLEALNKCDKLYFARPENIEVKLFEFIKANQDKIIP